MEILVVLIVAAIMAAVATPWMLSAIQSYRIRASAWEVAGDLRLVRQKAVSTQVRHRFCIANCDTAPPAGGYVLEREGTPWTLDLVRNDFPNGVAVSTTAPNGKVTFTSKGELVAAVGACVDVTNGTNNYKVTTAVSGRVLVAKGSCP